MNMLKKRLQREKNKKHKDQKMLTLACTSDIYIFIFFPLIIL